MGLPTRRFHKIRSLEVSGQGFLGGLNVNFSDGLNCVIGGRGAGKTTILEFLRYALDELPSGPHAKNHRQSIETLVERNLNGGRIRVGIETQDGIVYHVERSAGEERAEVLDEDDQPTKLTLGRGGLFGAEVYSQNEIERIADNPNFQLDLIDTFREEQISKINRQLRRLEIALKNNKQDLLDTTAQIEDLERTTSDLPLITERLERVFLNEDGNKSEDMERELVLKALRDEEQRVTSRALEAFREIRESMEAFVRRTRQDTQRLDFTRFKQGPNGELFTRLEEVFTKAMDSVLEHLNYGLNEVSRGVGEYGSLTEELAAAHRQQERAYQEVLQNHQHQRAEAQERLKLQRKQAELKEQKRECDALRERLDAAKTRRRELTQESVTLRRRRSALRQEVVAFLNERLSPEIRVSLEPDGDRSRFRRLLLDSFAGVGRPYRSPAETVASKVLPEKLAVLARTDDRAELSRRCKFSETQAAWILERLRERNTLLELEVVELGDVPRIELLDGDYKDAPRLSTGQKCTTILPILLLESEKPLLIDEPEGNLDNAFVYKTIVQKIRAVKPSRQLIFVTHNPNIPVLGDAERVVVLNSTGLQASVVAAGGVDHAKDHVERILEGGREAFEERRRRYGH